MRQAFFFATTVAILAGCAKSADTVQSDVKAESDAKPMTIPLTDIWALEMPGTKNIEELEREIYGDQARNLAPDERERRLPSSFVRRIINSLRPRGTRGSVPEAPPAFAVLGSGRKALQEAASVLVEEKEARRSFSSGSEITVVFFSHTFGAYVYLDHVECRGNKIEIRYRFVPHMTTDMSEHFALIPLGKLESGRYWVDITQVPMDTKSFPLEKPINQEWDRQVICKSFVFWVVDESKVIVHAPA